MPPDIRHALTLLADRFEVTKISPLAGGICNRSYIAETTTEPLVCQHLHPVLRPDIIDAAADISRFMSTQKGWPAPTPLQTKNNENIVTLENGDRLRFYRKISGSDVTGRDAETCFAAARLLATFHNDLKAYTGTQTPAHIPHFHDTAYFMDRLHDLGDSFTATAARLRVSVLKAWQNAAPYPDTSIQIIHGDARIQNFLKDDSGRMITIIDHDTFMRGSIFVDIGDLIRSVSCDDGQTTPLLDPSNVEAIIAGYAGDPPTPDFRRQCLQGFSTICLELAARFLNDVADDCYFDWDREKFNSRRENNIARAACQLELYRQAAAME